jgi:hypothetical protein
MPRTIRETLEGADDLATRFEDNEPQVSDERDPAVAPAPPGPPITGCDTGSAGR